MGRLTGISSVWYPWTWLKMVQSSKRQPSAIGTLLHQTLVLLLPFSSICKPRYYQIFPAAWGILCNWYKKPRDYWPKASQRLCFRFYWCNKYSALILLLHYSVGHYSPITWNRKLGILSYIQCHPTISDRNTEMYLVFFPSTTILRLLPQLREQEKISNIYKV